MSVQRRGVAAAVGLLVAACSALAMFAGYRFFVGTLQGQAVDQALLEHVDALPAAVAAAARVTLSMFTLPVVVGSALVPAAVALVRRTPWHAGAALVLVVGANATTQVLKHDVLERPDLLALGAPNSLPSGHTTVAASIALALALVAPPALRATTAAVGLAGSLFVGLATMVAGWHRASDVAAAVLVALAWAGLVGAALVLRPHRARPHAQSA